MPRKYIRKTTRGSWTKEALEESRKCIEQGMSLRKAEKLFGVPARTLARRLKQGNFAKTPLGFMGVLGIENERKLADHIKQIASAGFAVNREGIRRLAFGLAEKMDVKHKFNTITKKAGYDWLASFLERNKDISLRRSEGLPISRTQGMNQSAPNEFFQILQEVISKNNLMNKPGYIFNTDESGLKQNKKPVKVLTQKDDKDVHVLTAREKGENVNVVTRCNVEGILPPVFTMKGVNKKAEFPDGLPIASEITSNSPLLLDEIKIENEVLQETTIKTIPAGRNTNSMLALQQKGSPCSRLELTERNSKTRRTSKSRKPQFQSFFRGSSSHLNSNSNSSHSTQLDRRRSDLEDSFRCMRILIDATAKHDGHAVFGKQIAQKLRTSEKDVEEINIAKLLIDNVLQNLSIGVYNADTKFF